MPAHYEGVGSDKQFYQTGLGGWIVGGREGVKVGVVASRGGPGDGLAPLVLYWVTASYSGGVGGTSTVRATAAVVFTGSKRVHIDTHTLTWQHCLRFESD